jgi:uncharacterized protein
VDWMAAALLASAAPVLSEKVEVSPAVTALVQKHRSTPGPRLESELEALEKSGDASAAVLLGELLLMPNRAGGPDYRRSCDHSERGGQHPEGLHNLGTCYFKGSGRPVDLARARDLYRRAADQGYAKSACAYGNMLVGGLGGPADVARGIDLCRRAADAGVADAQTDYGGYLLTNQHVAKDAVQARRYLEPAAAKGHANAAFLLGQIYWNGDGVEKDLPQAAIWWITAYEGGRADAAFLIGNAAMKIVVEGALTKREAPTVAIDQARKWLAIAAREDPAEEKRQRAKEQMGLLEELLARTAK